MPKSRGRKREVKRRIKVSSGPSKITQHPIVAAVLDEILNSRMNIPVYRGDVVSADDAADKTDDLPLVYIWNENKETGSFTISINGAKVAQLLEAHLDRSDPRFEPFRDEVIELLARIEEGSVLDVCQQFQRFPSDLFVPEPPPLLITEFKTRRSGH